MMDIYAFFSQRTLYQNYKTLDKQTIMELAKINSDCLILNKVIRYDSKSGEWFGKVGVHYLWLRL